jgi:heme/copper-type cytochrome/quinol oxidase subunit 3
VSAQAANIAAGGTEAPAHGTYKSTKLPDIKLMMWVFLASDCMFFGTLIGTYLVYNGRSLTGPFPSTCSTSRSPPSAPSCC